MSVPSCSLPHWRRMSAWAPSRTPSGRGAIWRADSRALQDRPAHATIGLSMRLPYFPLHVVVFPHLPLPIQVFEDRYRAMTHDVVADGSPFAGRFIVSLIREGSEVREPGMPPPRAENIGTVVEVRSADRFADGRWALLVV